MKKSQKKKFNIKGFIRYCEVHPKDRFWQALRNYSGFPYVIVSPLPPKDIDKRLEDTFYFE